MLLARVRAVPAAAAGCRYVRRETEGQTLRSCDGILCGVSAQTTTSMAVTIGESPCPVPCAIAGPYRHAALRSAGFSRKLARAGHNNDSRAGTPRSSALRSMRRQSGRKAWLQPSRVSRRSSPRSASKLFLDGAVVAFHQLSLEVRRNEIMCVVGPSGCGKTTLLRCIAGLTDLSSGKLLRARQAGAGRPPDGVAMVFQHFGLLPWKTVLRQRRVRAGDGAARRGPRSSERVTHYLELVGLTGFESALSLSALRRHAAARRAGARARDEPVGPADGRAVRRARRADPRDPAGGTAAADGAARTSARPWCSSPTRSTRRSCSATASR